MESPLVHLLVGLLAVVGLFLAVLLAGVLWACTPVYRRAYSRGSSHSARSLRRLERAQRQRIR
ncbi:hypothetical protein AB0M20_31975 [Actinoplanes sp. NPDC051633]|uniref:hypothetical protein n=1 Tax=Actinoplanes sp. NPDC051633 TaxID=3155670 RepID=UPI0034150D19